MITLLNECEVYSVVYEELRTGIEGVGAYGEYRLETVAGCGYVYDRSIYRCLLL